MKVLLRNTLNGWYYQGPSKWGPKPEEALDLGHAAWALELVFEVGLENVEIMLCYDDPRYNLILPVERSTAKEPSVDLDIPGKPLEKSGEHANEANDKKPPL